MAKRYEELEGLITTAKADFEKFYVKGVKAAGTRIRKRMLELSKLAKEIRKEVLEIQKEREAEKEKKKK